MCVVVYTAHVKLYTDTLGSVFLVIYEFLTVCLCTVQGSIEKKLKSSENVYNDAARLCRQPVDLQSLQTHTKYMSRLHFITDYGDIQFFAAFTMPCICAGIFVYHTTTAMFRLPNGVYIIQNMFTHNMYSAHSVAYLNISKIFEIEVMFTRCRIFLFIRK